MTTLNDTLLEDQGILLYFDLDDLSTELSRAEIELVINDQSARHELMGRFLQALGWTDALKVAADGWRAQIARRPA